ncbi:hypothetical protein BDD12DRAFT_750655 [Trichophaea hybrida]|nr:hypothetical protein BDD12DRAFT_750655 [Trichophaea hybrida]
MWLRDMLPGDIRNIRVLIYGYDSVLPNSKSTASIKTFATSFLQSVIDSRYLINEAQRPILSIGHSLGGLVFKEVQFARSALFNNIFRSTYVAVLFGVPNRGLRNEALRLMVDGQPISHLVSDLAPDS